MIIEQSCNWSWSVLSFKKKQSKRIFFCKVLHFASFLQILGGVREGTPGETPVEKLEEILMAILKGMKYNYWRNLRMQS